MSSSQVSEQSTRGKTEKSTVSAETSTTPGVITEGNSENPIPRTNVAIPMPPQYRGYLLEALQEVSPEVKALAEEVFYSVNPWVITPRRRKGPHLPPYAARHWVQHVRTKVNVHHARPIGRTCVYLINLSRSVIADYIDYPYAVLTDKDKFGRLKSLSITFKVDDRKTLQGFEDWIRKFRFEVDVEDLQIEVWKRIPTPRGWVPSRMKRRTVPDEGHALEAGCCGC
ncbi:hypothetical protein BDV95DRAFT_591142 [Massariosphaeria phaeospora]|uniref:Uncharacterized protein n=1 Tax=Massariosphaeria phaeospora TaxID=100035 RepID=A0A7C8IJ99_9PLEO|nr:hypothetical protein BDV95DRAFT_591142 [Massariosphaeria phaeospora]